MVFKLIPIPSRFKIGLLGMTACSLLYALRVNLSVAIVAMVDQTRQVDHPDDWCPDLPNTNHSDTGENTVTHDYPLIQIKTIIIYLKVSTI